MSTIHHNVFYYKQTTPLIYPHPSYPFQCIVGGMGHSSTNSISNSGSNRGSSSSSSSVFGVTSLGFNRTTSSTTAQDLADRVISALT